MFCVLRSELCTCESSSTMYCSPLINDRSPGSIAVKGYTATTINLSGGPGESGDRRGSERGRGGAGSDLVGLGIQEIGWQPRTFLFGSPQHNHLLDQSSGWNLSQSAGLCLIRFRSKMIHSSRSASPLDWIYRV